MRILVVAPRKSGSAHLRCLLGVAYGVPAVGSRDAPSDADAGALEAWAHELPGTWVIAADFPASENLAQLANRRGIAIVALLRHPFDLFVSNHEVAQQRAKRKRDGAEQGEPWSQLAGRTLDDPAVLAYARDEFGKEFGWLTGWQAAGVPVVRYEELQADPASVLSALAADIGPLDAASIERAVHVCLGESLIASRPDRGRRMPALAADSWRHALPRELALVLRERYGAATIDLGYDID